MRELICKLPFCALVVLLSTPLYATTVIPFKNLGELAQSTSTIALVTAMGDYWVEKDGMSYYQTAFKVKIPIKGRLAIEDEIMVRSLRKMKGDFETDIAGDAEFEMGKSYLLFLTELEDMVYQVNMLSYYVLEAVEKDGREYLKPHPESRYMHTYPRPDGQVAEPLGVYHRDKLLRHLGDVVRSKTTWDKTSVIAGAEIERYFQSVETRSAPSACVYLGSSMTYTGTRWQSFPTIYYETNSSPLLPSGTTKSGLIGDAITRLNSGYTGLTIGSASSDSGYDPDCANNSNDPVASTNYLPYADASLNSSQSLFIQFDDPCSEISALSSCGGTLAYGGSWRSGSHSFNDESWRSAMYGYVVMNEIVNDAETANCLTEDEYETVLMHEISHALGLGHIDPGSYPNNNMNPSCCNDIGVEDGLCMDHAYVNTLPIELAYFDGKQDNKTVALNWGTLTEINNRFFTLEHSHNSKDFSVIAKITGAGNTTQPVDYQFVDRTPRIGPNYYRLSQTDFDGTTEQFEVITVDFSGDTKITVGPNPVIAGHTELTYLSLKEGVVEINIYDLSSQLVHRLSFHLFAGVNRYDLDLTDLPAGLYLVQVVNQGFDHIKKLTVF